MNKKEEIQKEIDRTLDLFEEQELLPSNPYFFTRVNQRLIEKLEKKYSFSTILKPAFFTALFVLNLVTAIWYTSSDNLANDMEANIGLTDILKSDFNLERDQTERSILE